MEFSFRQLRTKEVVNVVDGRRLGRVCDVVFCCPENRLIGIVAPDGDGGFFKRNEIFIEMCNIVKFGDDVVLVNVRCTPKQKGRRCGEGDAHTSCNGNGKGCGGQGDGARGYAPQGYSAVDQGGQNRRSYEEYE